MKLHLGCGDIIIPGFVNVDIINGPGVDVVDDVRTLFKFESDSVDVIYACHVLEHFGHDEILPILRRWWGVLKLGGELRVSVPDLDRIVEIYYHNWSHFQTVPNTPWIGLIYGGQSTSYDYHKTGFNACYLNFLLVQARFQEVSEYPHSPHWLGISDASLANQPFDAYISLNMRAVK
jgi:predicted SAM-dependent methyltransferase